MTIIATWNVNSIRSRINSFKHWVKDRAPDVILLQELKCQQHDFPHSIVANLGYNIELVGQKSYNGVAILSKFPIEDVIVKIPGYNDDNNARYIEAFTNNIRVASVYVPNGQEVGSEKFVYKMNFMNHLTEHVQNLLQNYENVVIGGDFNIAPTEQDGHNPERFKKNQILCSTQERNKMQQLLNCGFVDTIRIKYPYIIDNGAVFTWWDYRSGSFSHNKGYRIDHILGSSNVADLFTDCGIDRHIREEPKPSDHAPVWIKL